MRQSLKSPPLSTSVKGLAVTCLILFSNASGFAQEDEKAADVDRDDRIVLFDGTNLDHWRGYSNEAVGQGWKVEDGILKFDGSGGGDIVTREEFDNFELSFEWAVTPGANSGVMYRVGMGDSAPYFTAPEYQVLDNERHADGKSELTSAAALYGLYAPENAAPREVGEWNSGRIVVDGNRIEHWLNDTLVVKAELGSDDWKQRIANSKFKDWDKFATLASGNIALQDHGDEVWYRNITLRRFATPEDDK